MHVAALYDIHGNLPALEAVLADVEEIGVDLIVVGGDVAIGPMPRQTIEALHELNDRCRFVRGNGDRALVDAHDGATGIVDTPDDALMVEQLRPDHREFLATFEEAVVIDVGGLGSIRFCHGSPRSDEEIITALTSEERLSHVLAGVDERLIVCGHTPSQFDRAAGARRVVNAGSVGWPYEREPGAYWALFGPEVQLRRTAYDLDDAAGRIRASGWPGADTFVTENVLTTPDPDETAEHFERIALERERVP